MKAGFSISNASREESTHFPFATIAPSVSRIDSVGGIASSGFNSCNSPKLKDVDFPLSPHTYYRRELPASLTSFTSLRGKQLFRESLANGCAEIFFPLSGNFTHQSEPAYCALGSLAMVLNALELDPQKKWKGIWRWYSEEMLECCAPLEQIIQNGVTLQEFICLAKCNGLNVEAKRADTVSKKEFIHDIKEVCSSENKHMIVNFSRKSLNQTGDGAILTIVTFNSLGHFSPIGAYHEQEQKILVLDTARFKYPSYFCSIDDLYNSLHPIDKASGNPRGYVILTKEAHHHISLCRISSVNINWPTFSHVLGNNIPRLLSSSSIKDLAELVEAILMILPERYRALISLNQHGIDLAGDQRQEDILSQEHEIALQELINETEKHPLYQIINQVILGSEILKEQFLDVRGILGIDFKGRSSSSMSMRNDVALITIFMLASPSQMYATLPSHLQSEMLKMKTHKTDPILLREVSHIEEQIKIIMQTYCQCSNSHGDKLPCNLP